MAANQLATPWRDTEATLPETSSYGKSEIVAERSRNPPTAAFVSVM